MTGDPPRRLFLRKTLKLRSPREFERVYDLKQKAGDDVLLVFAAPGETPLTRFGLSVSRRHGPAVRRAWLKRRMREAFRLSQHDLPPGLDLILIPRQGVDPTVERLAESLRRLAGKLARRLADGRRGGT